MPITRRHPTLARWQPRALTVKPSDRPLIIGVAIAGAVILVLAVIWVVRIFRQKPPNPLPPVRPLVAHYAEGSSCDKIAMSPAADSFSSLSGTPLFEWKGEKTASTSTASGLHPPMEAEYENVRPRLPWMDSRHSSASLTTTNSSCTTAIGPDQLDQPVKSSLEHTSSPDMPSSIPPSPSQERRRLREALPSAPSPHPSVHSAISRHSLRSNVHSDSRHSLSMLSTSQGRPIRGAPHKTGIQIILPQPLAPAVIPRMVSQPSLSDQGHASRRALAKNGLGRQARADTWADMSRHSTNQGDGPLP